MIVITGATGNIGSKITSDLLSKEQHVRCIARTSENTTDTPFDDFAEVFARIFFA
jgi:uncharacterized protein YbjT (DUF2867 family)